MDKLKLTIQEAQDLLLLSQSSVYSWIDKGKLHAQETPGGKVIIISRKEAEEIKNFNLKSRRNKVAKQVLGNETKDTAEAEAENIINAEILENSTSLQAQKPASDLTLQLVSRIEELAVNAGRYKQLEILRNEEKENLKFWQEKYYEISAELKKKEIELTELRAEVLALREKTSKSLFGFFKKNQ